MSTNYYFRDKEGYNRISKANSQIKEHVNKIFSILEENFERDLVFKKMDIENATQISDEECLIHIGQFAYGWKVLLKTNNELYNAVSEMRSFYNKNKDKYEVVDEYGYVMTWEELEKEFLGLNEGKFRGDFEDKDGYCWSKSEFS